MPDHFSPDDVSDKDAILTLLHRVSQGQLSPDQALSKLRLQPFESTVSGVNLDLHRALRTGQAEVVFARGKTNAQLEICISGLAKGGGAVLATKCSPDQGAFLLAAFPGGEFWLEAGLFSLGRPLDLAPPWPSAGELMVVTAGSSDLPIALEAFGAARYYGLTVGLAPDLGVAGLHRMRPYLESLFKARLVIVVAGMEGALPSVVSGLCGRPILAVPTSVGYGASFGGLAALLAMLNSCAPGVSVVNIDNGFGAAVMAAKLLKD